MKRLLTIIIFTAISGSIFSQLTLDATYSSGTEPGNNFLFIQLDSAEYKYVVMDPTNSQFTLYNIDHSVYQNVTIPLTYDASTTKYTISYITRSLIDCDTNNIEYILSMTGDGIWNTYPKQTIVYRTDGTLLQTIDSCVFINFVDGWKYGPKYNEPVIKAPDGTKLLLRHLNNNDVKVYNLCGQLFQNIDETDNAQQLNPAFPNPTNNYITIPYSFPENENSGEILIYDVKGVLIRTFEVDDTFSNIIISTEEFASGSYHYNLRTGTQTIYGNTIIKIE